MVAPPRLRMAATERTVTVRTEIAGGRTIVTLTGERDAALLVRSASGERIYLPPEEDLTEYTDTAYDSPYDGAAERGTPDSYASSYGRENPPAGEGMALTEDGYRVVHPEPVTDLRLLR